MSARHGHEGGEIMEKKYRVGVIGATGYVGQRFLTILDYHPWFEVTALIASSRSSGRTYEEAVKGRWKLEKGIPEKMKDIVIDDTDHIEDLCKNLDFVFCAVDMEKSKIRELEEKIAKTETPVVSNNSAHRWTDDVPVIMPEINANHMEVIKAQKKRLGTERGFIATKPNCSIQSYVPPLEPLRKFGIESVSVCTYQAISGAGKTFSDWPEIVNNMIPFIGGEEDKSEREPLKIWGCVKGDKIQTTNKPVISSQCCRIGVQEGHTAAVSVKFTNKPSLEEILSIWKDFKGEPQLRNLPTAPENVLKYFDDDTRPQPKMDSDYENGMGITIGRLREDNIFDYKFICLSHNTIRGAAGGAVLTAELLVSEGYIPKKQ